MQQAARVSDVTAFFWLGELVEFDRTDKIFTAPAEKLTEDYVTGTVRLGWTRVRRRRRRGTSRRSSSRSRRGCSKWAALAEEQRPRWRSRALVERDHAASSTRSLVGDEPHQPLHIEIDDRCFKLLALHQPMAADLRTIVAAVKINTDLERVGDLAVNIAEAARRYVVARAGQEADRHPADGRRSRRRCCAMRSTRSSAATSTWRSRSSTEDDELDALKTQIFRELLTYMLQDPATIEPALDLILISRHLERIGDHATNIAEDVIFMVSARDVRHQSPTRAARRVSSDTRLQRIHVMTSGNEWTPMNS